MVRRILGIGALFVVAPIAAGACSDDETPEGGNGGTSGKAGMGGSSGRSNRTGGSGGEGGVESGGSGGSSGRAQGGTESGGSGGSGGRPPMECSSALAAEDLAGNPCRRGAQCDFGLECCCGECMPERECGCREGTWTCGWTDFCLYPGGCGGGGPGGSAGMGGAGT